MKRRDEFDAIEIKVGLPSATPPNKPMHPTADMHDVIIPRRAGRRVIGGVGLLREP